MYICSKKYDMLKQILLLSPLYVSLFWSITLHTSRGENKIPRLFLGKFMLFAFVVYLSHLFYYEPLRSLYVFIDPLYQLAMLMVYPMYYIYFRLLTIDNRFQLKKHVRFIAFPIILFVFYLIGVALTPMDEYAHWVFHRDYTSLSVGIKFLKIIYPLIQFTFVCEVFLTIFGNTQLIRKYSHKATQYYSDIEDTKIFNSIILNAVMVITGLSSVSLAVLGREFFKEEISGIAFASVLFSTMLFVIGWIGLNQKSFDPLPELRSELPQSETENPLSSFARKNILKKMLLLFEKHKIYLDHSLTIQNVAQTVGTNRTYISNVINQQFNLNFCSFVNRYRLSEAENLLRLNPFINNQELAQNCGFGSIDSMKRAVFSHSGKKWIEWKKQVIEKLAMDDERLEIQEEDYQKK